MSLPLFKFYKFETRNSTHFGKGNFATKKIVKGEIICRFAGPEVSLKQYFEKYGFNSDSGCNVIQIATDKYIDICEPCVFFNHSCDPNAGVRNEGVLFAIKDILPGEEIFFDYSTTADDYIFEMDCKCGSQICRKLITDFQAVPHDRKEFYLTENALTSHIRKVYY